MVESDLAATLMLGAAFVRDHPRLRHGEPLSARRSDSRRSRSQRCRDGTDTRTREGVKAARWVERECSKGSWSGRAALPQHRRGHEAGPKQNRRLTAEPCLLVGSQRSAGKNWSISCLDPANPMVEYLW